MNAAPAMQATLLQLQGIDTRIAQIAHQARTLPTTDDVDARVQQIRLSRAEAIGELDDARAELRRLESDVATVEARIARDIDLIASSSSAKDVAGLESELVSLRKRRSDLEDLELVAMERVELGERSAEAIAQNEAALMSERESIVTGRETRLAELKAEHTATVRDREAVAAQIDAPLLAQYDRIREHSAGVGAALLRLRTCGGCTMTLTGGDLERVRNSPADSVQFCPECDRILVRTEESGI
ncbi:MAG TPA: C4-type zinc ribbon domain-containing protein [Candidatus Lumbricidophila sp.]|nr:C4-type zinc ribbon domain-containing protein [Candidatus Lumbricidophila sp.]